MNRRLDWWQMRSENWMKLRNREAYIRTFELQWKQTDTIRIEMMEIHSRNLSKNLKGCRQVVLLCGTLGIEVDYLIKRYSYTEMAKAVVMQACAAALLEEYLDERQEEIRTEMEKQDLYLRPRFSPGYGDFSILHQREILTLMEASKKIGLTMTESSMLTPTKSVTALIGLSTRRRRTVIRKVARSVERRTAFIAENHRKSKIKEQEYAIRQAGKRAFVF